MSDGLLDVLYRSSGAVVVTAVLVVGSALLLGISLNSPNQFLDVRQWTQAIGNCLRQL